MTTFDFDAVLKKQRISNRGNHQRRVRRAVLRSIDFLNDYFGVDTWVEEIDLSTFDIESTCRCVLGQAFLDEVDYYEYDDGFDFGTRMFEGLYGLDWAEDFAFDTLDWPRNMSGRDVADNYNLTWRRELKKLGAS